MIKHKLLGAKQGDRSCRSDSLPAIPNEQQLILNVHVIKYIYNKIIPTCFPCEARAHNIAPCCCSQAFSVGKPGQRGAHLSLPLIVQAAANVQQPGSLSIGTETTNVHGTVNLQVDNSQCLVLIIFVFIYACLKTKGEETKQVSMQETRAPVEC